MCLNVWDLKTDLLEDLVLIAFPFFVLENIGPRFCNHSINFGGKMQSAWSSSTLPVALTNENSCTDG